MSKHLARLQKIEDFILVSSFVIMVVASFAQVGMGTGAYSTASGAGGYSIGNIYGPMNSSIFTASANNSTLPNYDLKPEVQSSWEFGADLRFLNGIRRNRK